MGRYVFLIYFFLTSCSTPPTTVPEPPADLTMQTVTDDITLFDISLQLVESNEKCYLISNKIKSEIAPKPPCYFLRNSKNGPQYYSYPEIGVEVSLIVSGTPITEDLRKQWNIDAQSVCGLESQGVLIKNGKVMSTDKTLEGGVICRDQGSDEKNYWYFSY